MTDTIVIRWNWGPTAQFRTRCTREAHAIRVQQFSRIMDLRDVQTIEEDIGQHCEIDQVALRVRIDNLTLEEQVEHFLPGGWDE